MAGGQLHGRFVEEIQGCHVGARTTSVLFGTAAGRVSGPYCLACRHPGESDMSGTPRLLESLERLRSIFRRTIGVELTDVELAGQAGLDADECLILLGVLQQTGAIDRPKSHVFVCRPTSWWAATASTKQMPSTQAPIHERTG
jgi:hypothetical protein